ncbi:hypothetical protein ACH0BF_19715 [Pseudobacillus sp. 179-B 2D1 NHS]|uniref:hypothetical protein n=1 Tax=Pseudobacillus sp. 179-B 2D1 NHS TaxID=3374292 RepID=UPI00387A5819
MRQAIKLLLAIVIVIATWPVIMGAPASASLSKAVDSSNFFNSMNFGLGIILGLAGFVVVGSIIFAGVKLASAQGNPQARTQGFIGLAVAFIGGWIVYRCLYMAGWIAGFGG